MLSSSLIRECATRVGFDLCGLTRAVPMEMEREYFSGWLSRGLDGGLDYLRANSDKRFDPGKLMPGARSAVVCALSYRNPVFGGYEADCVTKVASYAVCPDYHRVIRGMLHSLAAELSLGGPDSPYRVTCDSAPLSERSLAVRAGLGRQGRSSLLVTRRFGTLVLLGVLLTSQEIDRYDTPLDWDPCSGCGRCLEACPAGAITSDRHVDAGRCVSRLTVERPSEGDHDLAGWVFGCEECQTACPHNRNVPACSSQAMRMVADTTLMGPQDWMDDSSERARALMAETPMERAGLRRVRENILSNLSRAAKRKDY